MKLAWYTPYSQRSAIGLFSKEVVTALLELGHDVTIVRSESADSAAWKTSRDAICEIISAASINPNVDDYLSRFDCVLYNVGNHYQNHSYCLSHQEKVPGITLLHDYILHNLLIEWLTQSRSHSYLDALMTESGREAVTCYKDASDDLENKWFMSRAADHPVLRFAMQSTLGVVTHAEFYSAVCRSQLQCPVKSIPLAYCCTYEKQIALPQPPDSRFVLLTIGDVNANKRCEAVITALSESGDLSSRWQYRIVGNVSKAQEEKLLKLARNGKYPVDVILLGKVDDTTLQHEIKNSHAIACLRFPIIEGASASVIVSLASARPTLVSDGGSFAEIPEKLVYRVRQHTENADIQRQLTNIAMDYRSAVTRSLNARNWATQRHSGMQYAKSLIPFIAEVINSSPILKLVDSAATHLANWHCSPDIPTVYQVEAETTCLFGNVEV
ncbi:Glycosyl transferases group 1 [Pirellula sp. SH-Sr6A]|uniref:glycosyltransferase n=1 Tax=Pirellula sp. SH-Sr6A TaxID=1632865 RepID=UPI00078DDFC2|nr:glycosyltransferase [Pirellula sp. SH-Sr6A]AMV31365.1 Glycosyl transferases group 1 [Pirellula sp. SH-Sr6A]